MPESGQFSNPMPSISFRSDVQSEEVQFMALAFEQTHRKPRTAGASVWGEHKSLPDGQECATGRFARQRKIDISHPLRQGVPPHS